MFDAGVGLHQTRQRPSTSDAMQSVYYTTYIVAAIGLIGVIGRPWHAASAWGVYRYAMRWCQAQLRNCAAE